MRVVVVGAGVIGSVYAARLAAAGHEVGLCARGTRRAAVSASGLRVRTGDRVLSPDVELLADGAALPEADLVLVSVRETQLDPVLDLLAGTQHPAVAFLQHLGPRAGDVAERVGAQRAVLAFPGIGGLVHEDGTVEYVEIGAQPTTIDAAAPQALTVRRAVASTGMRTTLESDIAAWFATHEVFVACLGAAILACGGDAAALAGDRVLLGQAVAAVHEGFAALTARGISVTPPALRVLFSRMPRWFAAAYWRRALRGPVGTIALAPHSRASREDEFPLLCAGVLDRLEGSPTPVLSALLAPYLLPGAR